MRYLLREQLIQAYKTEGGFPMQKQLTEQLLRDCVNEAQEKGQIGLFIWANWTEWDDFAFELKEGHEHYDFALTQIKKGEEATIQVVWNGLTMPGLIAVSVQKMSSSNEFLRTILEICKNDYMEGPITLVPSNEVSDHC